MPLSPIAIHLAQVLDGLRDLGSQAASCSWFVEDALAALREANWDPRTNHADGQIALEWLGWLQQLLAVVLTGDRIYAAAYRRAHVLRTLMFTTTNLTLETAELDALFHRVSSLAGASPTTLSGDVSEALGLLADWQPEEQDDGRIALGWIEWIDNFLQRSDHRDHMHRRAIRRLRTLCGRAGDVPASYELIGKLEIDPTMTVLQSHYSDVHRARFNGSLVVAAKFVRMHSDGAASALRAFRKEAIVWRSIQHPNVVPFYGVHRYIDGRFCLISKWMTYGTLKDYLTQHTEENRVKYFKDIIRGLMHIHSVDLAHGDLKPMNILVDEMRRARIIDFGFTVAYTNSVAHTSSAYQGGTVGFTAPELLSYDVHDDQAGYPTPLSDIYSLGSVIYEILAGKPPYFQILAQGRRSTVVRNLNNRIVLGLRPERLPSMMSAAYDTMWGILEGCWAADPASRPSLAHINHLLAGQTL